MIADQKIDEASVQDGELAWEEACRREDAIRGLLHRHPQGLTVAMESIQNRGVLIGPG